MPLGRARVRHRLNDLVFGRERRGAAFGLGAHLAKRGNPCAARIVPTLARKRASGHRSDLGHAAPPRKRIFRRELVPDVGPMNSLAKMSLKYRSREPATSQAARSRRATSRNQLSVQPAGSVNLGSRVPVRNRLKPRHACSSRPNAAKLPHFTP